MFTREQIVESLGAVAKILEENHVRQSTLIVVGGSFLALHSLREATGDVDTISKITRSMREAVNQVAANRGLEPDWLNDRARPFAPDGLRTNACEVLLEHPRLLVLGPPADFVFLMKLYAARAPDYDDMIALWPRCSFSTPDDAVDRFYAAYPHDTPDPHLTEFVAGIAEAARRSSRHSSVGPEGIEPSTEGL